MELLRALPLGTVFPGILLTIGLVRQSHLGEALQHDWFMLVLAFIVGSATVALPRKFPLLAIIITMVVFSGMSTSTAFAPVALICSVLAGFFFGLFGRALLYQRKQRKQ